MEGSRTAGLQCRLEAGNGENEDMKNPCNSCMLYITCWARISLDEFINGFKPLAMTEKERDNCGVTHTAADIAATMGGACTVRKPEEP